MTRNELEILLSRIIENSLSKGLLQGAVRRLDHETLDVVHCLAASEFEDRFGGLEQRVQRGAGAEEDLARLVNELKLPPLPEEPG